MNKIGYITNQDLNNASAWSGIIYYIYKEISKKYEVVPIVVKDLSLIHI